MPGTTVEGLEKVLSDLLANRKRAAEERNMLEVQLGVNQSHTEHYDLIIATTRAALGDSAIIAKVEELLVSPPQETTPAPLASAGAGAAPAPAPVAADGATSAAG